MALIDDVLKLITAGFQVYSGEISPQVYRKLDCRKSYKARWFRRSCNFVCLGCLRQCSLADPDGFQLCLPYPEQLRQVTFFTPPAMPERVILDTGDADGFQLCLPYPEQFKKVASFFGNPLAIPDKMILRTKELLHPEEAATILRVSRVTLNALIEAGTIGTVRIRNSLRVKSEDVRKVLANGALKGD